MATLRVIFSLFIFFVVSHPTFSAPALPHETSKSRREVLGSPETSAKVETYDQLVSAIRATKAASQARVEAAVEQEKVREAWETGKLIDAHVLHHKDRADYDKQVIEKLGQDLSMDPSELYRMLKFARTYPILVPGPELSWSHYKALIPIEDSNEREAIAQEAIRESWDRDRLREEIRRRIPDHTLNTPEELLISEPGKVGTYRVVKAVIGPLTGQLVLDLGFSNYFQPSELSSPNDSVGDLEFKEGDIVNLENGKLKKIEAGQDQLFTYNVYVTQVIDGDTFRAVVDLGFKFSTVQTLRLRGLDAPELESAEGKEAKEFLAKQLAKNNGAVLVRTVKSDKYDRYLADVWANDRYVNQELIDEGLAVRVIE